MPATVNELLADAAIDHAVDLAQYSNHVIRRVIGLLNRVDARLASELAVALDRMPREAFTVERLESLLVTVKRINVEAYALVERELTAELQRFAAAEADYQNELFTQTIPGEIQVRHRVATITVNQAHAAAMSRPFQGRLLRDWAAKVEADRMEVIRNTVRTGYLAGETVPQIVTRLRGTRANNYADGTIQRSRRELETVVRTAINHTAAVARQEMVDANADLIAAVVWASTIDTRTSEICRIRDGLKYDKKTHRPIGHKVPWLQGPGRSHWNCRSTDVPAVKSWRELGFNIDELSPGTRASMDGQIPADTTFGDWLQRQNAYRQDQVVGPVRGKLMREGKLPFDKLYSDRGEWLTLDQLRERNAAAFKRAGLLSAA